MSSASGVCCILRPYTAGDFKLNLIHFAPYHTAPESAVWSGSIHVVIQAGSWHCSTLYSTISKQVVQWASVLTLDICGYRVLSGGFNSIIYLFFFWGGGGLMRGYRIQIPLKAGHHRPTSETPFKWHFAGGSMMAQNWSNAGFVGLSFSGSSRSVLLRNPAGLWFSRGRGSKPHVPHSGSAQARPPSAIWYYNGSRCPWQASM